jgi:hypothetical protein
VTDSNWYADGGYLVSELAVRAGRFFLEQGAESAVLIHHPESKRGWYVCYQAKTPFTSWHDDPDHVAFVMARGTDVGLIASQGRATA